VWSVEHGEDLDDETIGLLVLAADPLAGITKLARENMALIMAGGQIVKNDLA
jgi:hypothetical protein